MTAGIVVGVIILILVLLFGWVWVRGTKARADLVAAYPPPGKMVDVGGYRLHILCQGDRAAAKPTVVLVGGNGESCLTWAAIQPEIARFAPVCAYDRAGLGWSERSPKPRTAVKIAAELHALLAQAGRAPPYVLVGHSIGGLYARLYAHLYTDQVVIDALST